MNRWNRCFFDVIEKKQVDLVLVGVGIILILAVGSAAASVGLAQMRMRLALRWRQWITRKLIARWLRERISISSRSSAARAPIRNIASRTTPPGSGCSVIFGRNVTAAVPGSAKGLYLIVSDIEAARDELLGRGVEISEAFHDAAGVYAGADEPYLFGRLQVSGQDSEHRSYRSFASFSNPDGNGWLFQEVTARLPGRVDVDDTTFTSSTALAAALRRAAAAHGEHEKRAGGQRDEDWPD